MKRRTLLRSAALATAGLSLARVARADTTNLRIGAGLDDQSTPLLYAQHAGLFQKAGLSVDILNLPGGGAALAAAVAGGSLDIAKANTLVLITAHARNVPFTIIAPAAFSSAASPETALVVPVNSPMHTAKDFAGKTIGVVGLVTPQVIATKAWLDANGGDSQSVHFLEVPAPAIGAALDAGRIDAAPAIEPVLTDLVNLGKVRIIAYPYGTIAKIWEGADFFSTKAWVADHGDVVDRFNHVIQDANAYVAAHESSVIPLIAQYIGIDPDKLQHMHHPVRPAYVEPAKIQPLIDAAAKYAYIPAPFPAQDLVSDRALKRSS